MELEEVPLKLLAYLMLHTPVYVYDVSHEIPRYTAYFPSTIDRSLINDINTTSLYIYFTGNHFM